MIKNIFVFSLFTIILLSCDGGLSPRPESDKTFLNGTIHFVKGIGNWPPKDSVFAIRAAAFKTMPDSNIIAAIITGQAYFSDPLPLFKDSLNFSFEIKDAPVNIVYIVAVWQFTDAITDQRVIGVYSLSGKKDEISELYIEKAKKYNISIDVDFNDLPPMPF